MFTGTFILFFISRTNTEVWRPNLETPRSLQAVLIKNSQQVTRPEDGSLQ